MAAAEIEVRRSLRCLRAADRRMPAQLIERLAADPEAWFHDPTRRYPSKARRSDVVRVDVEGFELVGKRFNARTRWVALRRVFAPSPGWRAWVNAWRLLALGLRTPRPVLCLEQRVGPLRGTSYLFTERVDALPSDEYLADPKVPDRRKVLVLGRIIEAVARLHELGFAHRDLKARNLLIDGRGEVIFIDLDAMRRRWLPALRRRDEQADRARIWASLPRLNVARQTAGQAPREASGG